MKPSSPVSFSLKADNRRFDESEEECREEKMCQWQKRTVEEDEPSGAFSDQSPPLNFNLPQIKSRKKSSVNQ